MTEVFKFCSFLLVLLLISCKKKEIGPQFLNNPIQENFYFDVLVGCEGNFGTANGSITAFSSSSDSLRNYYFQQQNNFPLGDVVQSISLIDGELFIVVNNSGKVQVVDSLDLSSKYEISGLTSPREIIKISDSILYISDLYSNAIAVYDKENKLLLPAIAVSGWTESMIKINESVYVCSPTQNLVYKINSNSHQLVDSISVGPYPYDLVLDKNNMIWVLCSGEYNMNNGTLEKINPSSFNKETVVDLNASASNLCLDGAAANIYWISNGVNKMNVDQSVSNLIIPSNSSLFYGLGVHPVTNDIYVADAIDYVQSGKLMIYSNDGSIIKTKTTGINPQAILFK